MVGVGNRGDSLRAVLLRASPVIWYVSSRQLWQGQIGMNEARYIGTSAWRRRHERDLSQMTSKKRTKLVRRRKYWLRRSSGLSEA